MTRAKIGLDREDIVENIIAKALKDEEFKQQLLSDPKAAIAKEFEVELPEGLNIQILQEDSNTQYIVLPQDPHIPSPGSVPVNTNLVGDTRCTTTNGSWCSQRTNWCS